MPQLAFRAAKISVPMEKDGHPTTLSVLLEYADVGLTFAKCTHSLIDKNIGTVSQGFVRSTRLLYAADSL